MLSQLHKQIFLAMLLVLLLLGTLAYFLLHPWLVRQNEQRAQEHLKAALGLGLAIANSGTDHNWQTLAEQISALSGYRVSFINSQGQVLADSILKLGDFARQENHGKRSEVSQALQIGFGLSRRHSSSLGQSLIYVAQPLADKQVVLRMAVPFNTLEPAPIPWSKLAPLMGAALLLLCLLSYWLARRFDNPLQRIIQCLPTLEQGQCAFSWRSEKCAPSLRKLGQGLEQAAQGVKHRLNELDQNAARMRGLLQGMVEPVLVLDKRYEIILANQAAEQLFGPNLIGQHPAAAIRSAELLAAMGQAVSQGYPLSGEIKLPGQQVWQTICSPLSASSQELVIIMHNITQEKKLESIRRDFVANLSHEIRTPLAVIQGAHETLGNMQNTSAEQQRFLDSIGRQVGRLQMLMEDLLKLARLESAQWHDAGLQTIEVAQLIEQACQAMQERANALQVEIVLEQPLPQAAVMGDYSTLEQAITNLLDNAIKYSPSGAQVRVNSQVRDRKIYIEVHDHGPGIAPEQQERIFERFYRVDKSRAAGSTGLGLAIVRHAALLHGGQALVSSHLNQGSVFTIILPQAQKDENHD